MSRAIEKPTGPDRVREIFEQMRQARLSSGAINAEMQKLQAQEREANAEYERERAARLTGDESAAPREQAAAKRRDRLRLKLVELASDSAATVDITRSGQDKIDRIRRAVPQEFYDEADEGLPAFYEARDAAVAALENYVREWGGVASPYVPMAAATAAFITKREGEMGVSRDIRVVNRDSTPPPCPVDEALLTRLREATPKPRALADDYYEARGLQSIMNSED